MLLDKFPDEEANHAHTWLELTLENSKRATIPLKALELEPTAHYFSSLFIFFLPLEVQQSKQPCETRNTGRPFMFTSKLARVD